MTYSHYLKYLVSDDEYDSISQEFESRLRPVLQEIAEELIEEYNDPSSDYWGLSVDEFSDYINDSWGWGLARQIASRVGWDPDIAPHMKSYLSNFVNRILLDADVEGIVEEVAYELSLVPREIASTYARRGLVVTTPDGEYEGIEVLRPNRKRFPNLDTEKFAYVLPWGYDWWEYKEVDRKYVRSAEVDQRKRVSPPLKLSV